VLTAGGLPIVEVTMTVPGAIDVNGELIQTLPHVIVGAGTVLDLATARACADAGAMFLTSPTFEAEVVRFANKRGILVMPGALTPTEVNAASQAGADLVKVYPCGQVGGPSYIRALRGPFPQVSFVAAGGVHQHTAADYIRAGAAAVDVGADLIPRKAIAEHQIEWITELTRRFLSLVKEARAEASGRNDNGEKAL
jgi:2-dehydro-3-deoxyphosphogluconate aldolase/(4S)-4-hydroxy-2-oxoglutarate aldolase